MRKADRLSVKRKPNQSSLSKNARIALLFIDQWDDVNKRARLGLAYHSIDSAVNNQYCVMFTVIQHH